MTRKEIEEVSKTFAVEAVYPLDEIQLILKKEIKTEDEAKKICEKLNLEAMEIMYEEAHYYRVLEITELFKKWVVVEDLQQAPDTPHRVTKSLGYALKGSPLDINFHQDFDTSKVERCVQCFLPLSHKKSLSIAMGPDCSGMGYSNQIDWNVVIEKLTTKYREYNPKYVKVDLSQTNVLIIQITDKGGVELNVQGETVWIPLSQMVFISEQNFDKYEKINPDKRLSKNNKKIVVHNVKDTLLVKRYYYNKNLSSFQKTFI